MVQPTAQMVGILETVILVYSIQQFPIAVILIINPIPVVLVVGLAQCVPFHGFQRCSNVDRDSVRSNYTRRTPVTPLIF